MKVRSDATLIAAVVLAFGGYYFYGDTVTSEDIAEKQKKIHTEYHVVRGYANELKGKYVEEREQCREDGKWKDNKKCQAIKEVDPKAQELWERVVKLDKELQKADSKVDEVEQYLEDINRMKRIVVQVAEAI